jgi:hypothetical protein
LRKRPVSQQYRRRFLFLGRRMLRNFVAFSSQMATEYRNKDFMLEDLAQLRPADRQPGSVSRNESEGG